MSRVHTVKQGECLSSIAQDAGFFWETLWNHPENSQLKKARKHPNVLLPGDKVFIPDKEEKEESCASGRVHTFRKRGIPVKLNIRMLDANGQPRAGLSYTLEVDGKQMEGVTSSNGLVSEAVSPSARKARLTLKDPDAGEETYDFQLGSLNPTEDVSGLQSRLKNLGFYKGPADGNLNDETKEAISKLQAKAGLPVTGTLDAATLAELNTRHGV